MQRCRRASARTGIARRIAIAGAVVLPVALAGAGVYSIEVQERAREAALAKARAHLQSQTFRAEFGGHTVTFPGAPIVELRHDCRNWKSACVTRFLFAAGLNGTTPGNLTINSECDSFLAAGNSRSTADQMTTLGIDPATMAYCSYQGVGSQLATYDIFHTPRGAIETKSRWMVDIQVSKGFRIGPTHLDLIVSVLNVFSQETVTGVCDSVSGCGGDIELGDPIGWETPRSWEVGFRLTF